MREPYNDPRLRSTRDHAQEIAGSDTQPTSRSFHTALLDMLDRPYMGRRRRLSDQVITESDKSPVRLDIFRRRRDSSTQRDWLHGPVRNMNRRYESISIRTCFGHASSARGHDAVPLIWADRYIPGADLDREFSIAS